MASTALASPALARDGQWYVEVGGGPMIFEDVDLDLNSGADTLSIETGNGYDFGGIVGYDFGAFRLEAEAGYREADVDGVTTQTAGVPTSFSPSSGQLGVRPGNYAAAGDINMLSFMLNGLFDFGPDDGLQGYFGGGIGVARTDLQGSVNATGPGFADDSDSGLAWQMLAGVRAPISESWDAGLRYRMFTAENVGIVDPIGRTLDGTLRTHSIMGTLTYNFGGEPEPEPTQTCWNGSVLPVTASCPARPAPPPPPPVPVPPPPPPPPAPPPCNKGPYIVFFEWDQSDVTPEAATILDNAVSQYANCGSASVMLAGHTDSSGSTTYNEGLADRRNSSVNDYLTGRGVPAGRISSEGFGESQLRVPTGDGVRELQNRRVEVSYGPNAGM